MKGPIEMTWKFAEASSGEARTEQFWMEIPVFSFGSSLDCAVTALNWPRRGSLANRLQNWKTTAALPKMKSTVPAMSHSR